VTHTVLVAFAVVVALYAVAVLVLIVLGRRGEARALAGFIPDCLVLFKRLIGDPRVPRRRKVLLGLMVGYLAMPIDLVPDFIPVAGQLDDAILVGLVLRSVLRGSDDELLGEHWPGPEQSLRVIERFAYGSRRTRR
jgi:uncharacterized membrane protein YkvA (DUF1232 family)